MKLSFKTSLQGANWNDFVWFWREAEAANRFTAGWVNDHMYDPGFESAGDSRNTFEAFTALSALAGRTSRIQLGILVTANLFRQPALLARMATTIDHVCDGRLILGMGAGWHEREHADHGIDLMSPGRRLDALEESLEIVTRLMSGETFDFSGEHHRLSNVAMDPLPINPNLPIMIGGGGERRTLRIVARFADQWNLDGESQIDVFDHKRAVLERHCEAIGRDPGEIETSLQLRVSDDTDALMAALARCREVGVDHAILSFANANTPHLHQVLEQLDRAGY